ncbi:unnamed protein product [Protopolystoma xenopodis]|uniref:Uncharacterized protein n=1 Tax=Protopolystoma xenopodis TaxID=117903 RepID=A0A3S5CD33_9PLAT|nr:unnamed protein product [Protopolystoma xenopodis]
MNVDLNAPNHELLVRQISAWRNGPKDDVSPRHFTPYVDTLCNFYLRHCQFGSLASGDLIAFTFLCICHYFIINFSAWYNRNHANAGDGVCDDVVCSFYVAHIDGELCDIFYLAEFARRILV